MVEIVFNLGLFDVLFFDFFIIGMLSSGFFYLRYRCFSIFGLVFDFRYVDINSRFLF